MQQMLEELERRRAAARLGGGPAPRRGAARQGQADGPRAHRRAARSRLVRGIRHVRRASLDRLRHGDPEDPGRRRGDRPRHDQRPAGLCLQPGFHRVRRRALGHACGQDLQGHGHRHEGRRAGAGAERFRRRAHPGRRRFAGGLCRRVPAQRAGLGRDPADLHGHGPVRRRRGLFAGHDRLHLHGEGQLLHVRDRSRRGEDRDARDGDAGGAGRRAHPYAEVGRRRSRLRERRRCAAAAAPLRRFPAVQQPREGAGPADAAIRSTATTPRSTRWCRTIRTSPTTSRS